MVQRFLGDPTVSLSELEKNVSLVLVNSHYSLGQPRPLMPNVVEVGAMHCRPAQPLQDLELRQFLDESPVPVVYFSLGSHIRSQQLPPWLRQALVTAFKRLPYRVLWKLEGGPLDDLPFNVMTRPWLPQQDVLGHNNVRAFLTHGGLLSLQESVYHNVPIVGLPLMSDQHTNIQQAVAQGFGRHFTLESLTSEKIYEAIKAVVEEEHYKRRVEESSQLLRDQLTKPLDRAVYWTEHVLRYGGAPHLRSAAADMPLHQYLLLDVAGVLTVMALVVLLLLYVILRISTRAFLRLLKKTGSRILGAIRTHTKLE